MILPYNDLCVYSLDDNGGFYIFSGRLKEKEWDYLNKWAAWNGFVNITDNEER